MLDALIQNTKNKSENQMKTLAQTILPRIALHKCLSEEGFSEEDVYKYMRKYMLDKVAAKKHASTAKMELVPDFMPFTAISFLKLCVQPICKKVRRHMEMIIMMLRLKNACGTPPAWKTAVKICAACSVMSMM